MPHREAAWTLIEERLRDACAFARSLQNDSDPVASDRLAPVAEALDEIADSLGALRRLGRGQPLRRRPADFGGSPPTSHYCWIAHPSSPPRSARLSIERSAARAL